MFHVKQNSKLAPQRNLFHVKQSTFLENNKKGLEKQKNL